MTDDQAEILKAPLELPCGVVLKNRLAKAAMTEGLAGPDGLPNEKHARLYRTWAESGVDRCGQRGPAAISPSASSSTAPTSRSAASGPTTRVRSSRGWSKTGST